MEQTVGYNDAVKKWRTNQIKTAEDLDIALDNFRILFAYHSNSIENPETTYHDTREIFENGKLVNYTGDLRTLYEIENQKKCYERLKHHIIDRDPVKPRLIKEIHELLMHGCYDETRYAKGERSGEYKKNDYVTGDNIGSLPQNVAADINNLCLELTEHEGDILTAAAYLHLVFESIHPFADGNGRVGRTLMNYYLMVNDYPPTIIYSEDKDAYYMALAVYDKTGELDGFRKFIMEQTVKTWHRTQTRHQSLKSYI